VRRSSLPPRRRVDGEVQGLARVARPAKSIRRGGFGRVRSSASRFGPRSSRTSSAAKPSCRRAIQRFAASRLSSASCGGSEPRGLAPRIHGSSDRPSTGWRESSPQASSRVGITSISEAAARISVGGAPGTRTISGTRSISS
jgi:hypothetical protein